MIQIYTDSSFLVAENRGCAHPLVFELHYFDRTHKDVFEHYTLVSNPSIADVFLFPIDYLAIDQKGCKQKYQALYKLAVSHHKKLMVYTGGDYGKTFNDTSVIVWRNAGFKSKNDTHTVIIPAFIEDPLEREGMDATPIAYAQQPQISFTGFATDSLKEALRIFLSIRKGNIRRVLKRDNSDRQNVYNAARQRFRFLRQLETSNLVETDVIYRTKYRGGAITDRDRELTERAFFTNVLGCPYTFCLRGAGNFSVRFYESLACGRIPVLVDTDGQLPLEDRVAWENHLCNVPNGEDLVRALFRFHKRHTQDTFVALQQSNRALYQDYLVRDRFFLHLYSHLKQIL